MTAPAPEAPVDFAALGQVVHEEISRLRAEEQEIIRRESEIQTMLAKRRFPNLNEILAKRYRPEHLGAPKKSPRDLPPAKAPSALTKPIQITAARMPKTARSPRAQLAKKVVEAWATKQGQDRLVGQPLRVLKNDFGLKSHTSFYDVPFFVKVIKPKREQLRLERLSARYLEQNARARD